MALGNDMTKHIIALLPYFNRSLVVSTDLMRPSIIRQTAKEIQRPCTLSEG